MSSTDQTNEYDDPTEGETPLSTEMVLRSEVDDLKQQIERVKADQRPRLPISRNPVDEWVLVVRDYNLLAQSLARTAFVPDAFAGKPDQVTAAMMYGREVGLGPMTTLQNTVVIHGKVSMYAEQLRAMVLAAGHEFEIEEMTSDRCVVQGRRQGKDRWQTFSYTMDQAKTSGLFSQNEQYRKRPVEMLFARASAIMCHAIFADVIRGMGAVEEYEAQDADTQPDNAPAPAAKAPARVGRKAAAPKALNSQPTPNNSQAGRNADQVVIPDEAGLPPLPGEAEAPTAVTDAPATVDAGGSAGSTPGEGAADPAAPAEPPTDPVEARDYVTVPEVRHCSDFDNVHPPHTWRSDDLGTWLTYDCQGVKPASSSAAVPVAEPPMTKADTIMVQARFKNLGFTDEPDDREARLRIASTILGRPENEQVETFRAVHPGEGGMTKPESQRVLKALAPCNGRDDVAELLLNMTRKADGNG